MNDVTAGSFKNTYTTSKHSRPLTRSGSWQPLVLDKNDTEGNLRVGVATNKGMSSPSRAAKALPALPPMRLAFSSISATLTRPPPMM